VWVKFYYRRYGVMSWKELLEDVLKDLEGLDDVIFPDEESDSQSDGDEEEEEMSIEEVIYSKIAEYFHLEDYDRQQVDAYLSGLASILKEADSWELFNFGVLLIYMSERRWVRGKLTEFLEEIGF
jgi:hypothetical protein